MMNTEERRGEECKHFSYVTVAHQNTVMSSSVLISQEMFCFAL